VAQGNLPEALKNYRTVSPLPAAWRRPTPTTTAGSATCRWLMEKSAIHKFSDWPNREVPRLGAGVYTIWHKDGRFIYVGMSGRGITAATIPRNSPHGLYTRMHSHWTGRRSGDQFSVYVADRFVLPTLNPDDIASIVRGGHERDALVRIEVPRFCQPSRHHTGVAHTATVSSAPSATCCQSSRAPPNGSIRRGWLRTESGRQRKQGVQTGKGCPESGQRKPASHALMA
jgi:hypothetical protein